MICYCFELKSCSRLTTQGFANALNVVAAVFSGSSQVLAVGIFMGLGCRMALMVRWMADIIFEKI